MAIGAAVAATGAAVVTGAAVAIGFATDGLLVVGDSDSIVGDEVFSEGAGVRTLHPEVQQLHAMLPQSTSKRVKSPIEHISSGTYPVSDGLLDNKSVDKDDKAPNSAGIKPVSLLEESDKNSEDKRSWLAFMIGRLNILICSSMSILTFLPSEVIVESSIGILPVN